MWRDVAALLQFLRTLRTLRDLRYFTLNAWDGLLLSAACPIFGFVVQLRTNDARALAHLLDRLREELLQGRGLLLTDGEAANQYVVTGDGFQATNADREAVIAWLAARSVVGAYTVGALDDVGHVA